MSFDFLHTSRQVRGILFVSTEPGLLITRWSLPLRERRSLDTAITQGGDEHFGPSAAKIISDCEVSSVTAVLLFARAHEIDRTDSKAFGWFSYGFTSAVVIVLPGCNTKRCKQGRHDGPFRGAVHPKVVLG